MKVEATPPFGSTMSAASSNARPGPAEGLNEIVERNIQALVERRRREDEAIGKHEQIIAKITRFIGSVRFVYLHIVLFGTWTLANTAGIPGIPVFDPELVLMGTFAAIEAIFLTTLVLITQNRMALAADKRSELDLQINLLTEHELTRLISVVSAIENRLNVRTEVDTEIRELKEDVEVHAVLDKIESADDARTAER